jgi:hypothetical protein
MFTERFVCNQQDNKELMARKTLIAEESCRAGVATFGAEQEKTKVTQTRL